MKHKLFGLLCLLVAAIGGISSVAAQSNRVITIGFPDYMRSLQIEEIFEAFEAQNPGIEVQTVYIPFSDFVAPSPEDDLEEHLLAMHKLASAADVIMVERDILSVLSTRAGYFLNLKPLTTTDTTLDPRNFVSAAWDAFNWDEGLWGLPTKFEPYILVYDPAAFDAAGLAYPNPNWTIDDLANAARALTQRDASGEVVQHGFITNGLEPFLLRSLTGSMIDSTVTPSVPRFSTPELQDALEKLSAMFEEGAAAQMLTDINMPTPALQITGSYGLIPFSIDNTPVPNLEATTLPGGKIGLIVDGYAVSNGTPYPQEAYLLTKFMTENQRALEMSFSSYPARTDVTISNSGVSAGGATTTSISISGSGSISTINPEGMTEINAMVDALLPSAMSASESRFDGYLQGAISAVVDSHEDALSALQNAETQAIADLQTATNQNGTQSLVVATPVPQIVLAPGEIALKFGAGFAAQTGDWDRLLQEFVAQDPEVGDIILDRDFGQLNDYASRNDCFYLNYNAIPTADLSKLLPIDPLTSVDPNFSASDIVGNTLEQVQRDNHLWAYPFHIDPEVLRYSPQLFASAGIAEPTASWTTSEFVDALNQLKRVIEDSRTPLNNRGFGDTYLLMLIAAYGGLPIDYSTTPPSINFTDPATVDAIRQVLDLAKADLISYSQLATNGFAMAVSLNAPLDGIVSEPINGIVLLSNENTANPYRLINYPSGGYNAVSYEIGAGYISATAQNPNACYRLLQFLGQHPELFNAMPASRLQFNNPALVAANGANAVDFYTNFAALMQDPNTVIIPSSFSGGGDVSGTNIIRRWLNHAFDQYVLDGVDLMMALTEAQTKADAFQVCTASAPPFDANNPDAYTQAIGQCASAIDPDIPMMFAN